MDNYIYIDQDISPVVSDLSNTSLFSFDIETSGLRPLDSRMLLAQIGLPDKAYVINLGNVKLDALLPFFADPKILVIIQNAKFEASFMQYFYNARITNIFDTMLAEQIMDTASHGGASLGDLAKKYLNKTRNKDIRKQFVGMKPMQAFTTEQLEYAADDAIDIIPIFEQQKAKLEKVGLEKIARIEFDLAPVVASMENAGMPLDVNKWQSKLKVYEQRHEESRLKMNALIFDDGLIPEQMGMFVRDGIDLDSPKKLKAAFQKIGIDIESTSEQEIALIDHPAAKELLVYRELQKLKSSYGTTLLDKIHPFTNRLHADFQQVGTRTGRFSCKEPNLQQMPADLRSYIGLEGHKIVGADFSQIELRILAELSKDKALNAALNSGADLHASTAATMFNIPLEKVDSNKRFIAKTINFGLVYGIGVNKLKDILNKGKKDKEKLTFNQVKQIMNQYKIAYKGAIEWLRDAGDVAYAQNYSKTILGRYRHFTKPVFNGDQEAYDKQVASIKRQGANSPIQGTSADITKIAMVNLEEDLSQYNFRAQILAQVHDEIIVLAHNSQAESVKQVVIESMMNSAQEVLKDVPVAVEGYVSDYWKKGG